MCKHVAAAMYGVGARLDAAPELLFTLRQVSLDELVASALEELPAAAPSKRVLANDGLAALFGIELADPVRPPARKAAVRPAAKVAARALPIPASPVAAKPGRAPAKPARGVAAKQGRAAAKPARAAAKPARNAARSARTVGGTPARRRTK
jgi:uncharacterized Zn finger protein